MLRVYKFWIVSYLCESFFYVMASEIYKFSWNLWFPMSVWFYLYIGIYIGWYFRFGTYIVILLQLLTAVIRKIYHHRTAICVYRDGFKYSIRYKNKSEWKTVFATIFYLNNFISKKILILLKRILKKIFWKCSINSEQGTGVGRGWHICYWALRKDIWWMW